MIFCFFLIHPVHPSFLSTPRLEKTPKMVCILLLFPDHLCAHSGCATPPRTFIVQAKPNQSRFLHHRGAFFNSPTECAILLHKNNANRLKNNIFSFFADRIRYTVQAEFQTSLLGRLI
jgi:hypothetical protein